MNNETGAPQTENRQEPPFTEKQIGNFVAFGDTLRRIHARLMMEGYKIEGNGTITKPSKKVIVKVG